MFYVARNIEFSNENEFKIEDETSILRFKCQADDVSLSANPQKKIFCKWSLECSKNIHANIISSYGFSSCKENDCLVVVYCVAAISGSLCELDPIFFHGKNKHFLPVPPRGHWRKKILSRPWLSLARYTFLILCTLPVSFTPLALFWPKSWNEWSIRIVSPSSLSLWKAAIWKSSRNVNTSVEYCSRRRPRVTDWLWARPTCLLAEEAPIQSVELGIIIIIIIFFRQSALKILRQSWSGLIAAKRGHRLGQGEGQKGHYVEYAVLFFVKKRPWSKYNQKVRQRLAIQCSIYQPRKVQASFEHNLLWQD